MPNEFQMLNQTRRQSRMQGRDLAGFDYSMPAELFPSRNKKGGGRITYKRFDTAAEALRFAVEDMPGVALLGAYLEIAETRFGEQEIQQLYESDAYPLKRRAKAD
jgi:hypothetical protein